MVPNDPLKQLLSDLTRSRLAGGLPESVREELAQQAVSDVLERFPRLPIDQQARLAFVRFRFRLLDHQRQESRRAHLLRLSAQTRTAERSAPVEASDALEAQELRRELRQAMTEVLRPEQRLLLWRRFQRGESVSAIARSLGRSRNQVDAEIAESIALLARALKLLSE